MDRKIFVCGLHAVGKTAILHALRTFIPGAHFLDLDRWEQYRKPVFHQIIDRMHDNILMVTQAFGPLTFFDRSPFDNLLYAKTFHELQILSDDEYLSIKKAFLLIQGQLEGPGHLYLFLNPPSERISRNWSERNPPNDSVLYQPLFLQTLKKNYEDFFATFALLRPTITLSNYTATTVLEELIKQGWVVPMEILDTKK